MISISILICCFVLSVIYFSIAPPDFQSGQVVHIKKGMYMSQAADLLASDNIVKSAFFLKIYVMMLSGHRQVQAGEYLFDSPQSALGVAYRLVYGIQGLPQAKVTLQEGMTSADMAAAIKKAIPQFDAQTFIALAKPLEGQLFPDTYFLYPDSTPQDVIDLLHANFTEKTKPLLLAIQAFGKPASEVITMASIVEKEATSTADRRIIAGILWKRLAIGMPLQVDPPFYYLLHKDSSQLTMSDLAIDSPYNLYKHTGLPPTPIDNPGLNAIEATIDPVQTGYLYYLSGRDGQMHYASTLAAHLANKTKYLDP